MNNRPIGRSRNLLGLQGDSDQTGGHLFNKRRGRHGELEEQNRFGTRVELDGEVDVAAAMAEESSGDISADGGSYGEVSSPKPFAGGNDGGEREKIEKGTKEGRELVLGFGKVVE